ncbi:MAG: YqgQ family protein [Clostridia bacterium]
MERQQPFNLDEFLRRFSLFFYTGDPEGDLLLIEDELKEMRQLGLIDKEEYIEVLAALKARRKTK